jgi:hypothetical protein
MSSAFLPFLAQDWRSCLLNKRMPQRARGNPKPSSYKSLRGSVLKSLVIVCDPSPTALKDKKGRLQAIVQPCFCYR